MDRLQIKAEAKKKIKNHLWDVWKPLILCWIIVFGISLGVGFLSALSGIDLVTVAGDYTVVGFICEIILGLVSSILGVGALNYWLKFVREDSTDTDHIFNRLGKLWISVILITLLVGIFTTLWTFLLIIPGIIAAFSYVMVNFVLLDDEDLSPMEVIKRSKQLMNGYKLDYFVFALSFMGWILLSVFTLGILFIWTLPYIEISFVLYYEKLKERLEEKKVTK